MKATLLLIAMLSGLVPAAATAKELTPEQLSFFTQKCMQCHVNPATGAPVVGLSASWQDVLSQGMEQTLSNVVMGKGGMPPLGSCSACSEADFRALIEFMSGMTDAKGANNG